MATEQEVLCRAIDEELAAFLRCIDNYETASREIVSACKSGVFDMARARKSMGHGGCAVSQLQYPARMKAAARIAVDGRQLPATGHGPAATSREAVLELTVQNFVRSEGSVRSAAMTDHEAEEDESDDDDVLCTDPIRWFGVFAPQHLKSAQKYFSRGLQSVASAADASVKMRLHYARYQELLAQKKALRLLPQ